MAYSSKNSSCRLYKPGFVAWAFYNVVLLYFGFFILGVTHELAHGLGAGLTGGTFGFTSSAGNIIGGYGLLDIFLVVPVFYVGLAEAGNEFVMLIAGPLSTITVAVLASFMVNQRALMNTFGSCRGRNLWLKSRGLVWGFVIRGWFDAVYIGPIDVFPGAGAGDGMRLHDWFVANGYVVDGVYGLPIAFSAGHVVMAASLLAMTYATYRIIKCTPTFCTCKL